MISRLLNKYWVKVEDVLMRRYETITMTRTVAGEKVKKSVSDVFLAVPQTLEEVELHSEMNALELSQWAIAYKRYLMVREDIHDSEDIEATITAVNATRVAMGKEEGLVSQFKKLSKEDQARLLDSI